LEDDIPELIEANVKAMADTALKLYKIGHMPVLENGGAFFFCG
jgi:hypothetical protein